MTDTCTWLMPVNLTNTGTSGYSAIPGWSMDTAGPYGASTSTVDSSNRLIQLRRNGNSFQYNCITATVPTTTPVLAVCDNNWRYIPQGGATPAQPVGVYVSSSANSTYRDAIAIAVRASGGTPSGLFVTGCRFNGASNCTFDTNWPNNLGASTSMPPHLRASSTLSLAIKDIWGNWYETINKVGSNSSWNSWVFKGGDPGNLNWGQPFRTVDKVGRYWQFRSINGSIAYACGSTPVCVTLNYDSSKSSISKTNLSGGEAFTVKCDYGVKGVNDAVAVTSGGGATCTFANWDSTVPTTANFNCTAGTTSGTYSVACVNSANTSSNVCAQTNTLGNITVSALAAVADINANPLTIPYNSASTISWTSSNASSCSVTPTGWIGTSGSQSSGNLTASRTYSLDCLPSGPNSSDSVTVTVQPASNFTLNVIRSGQGTVTSAPAGINCGATCNASYVQNTSVTLTATPAQGRIFTGWGGACSGKGTCTVVMSSSRTVYANFAVDPNFKEF